MATVKDVENLKNKLGCCKSRIEAFNGYINDTRELVLKEKLKKCQFVELQMRVEKVESTYKQYERLQSQLETAGYFLGWDDKQITNVFESNFYKALSIAKVILNLRHYTVSAWTLRADAEKD